MTIVFRASGVGHPCDRKLWYEYVQGIEEPRELQTLFTFDIGTALEPVVVKYLELDGWEIRYNAGSQEAEIETVIPVSPGIEIRGHHDLILRRPGAEWIMADVKTMNSFAFKNWKKYGTMRKYPQYCDQLTVYTNGLYAQEHNIRIMGVFALNKDKAEFPVPYDLMEYEQGRMDEILARVEEIAMSTEPPCPPDTLPTWACGYCGYKKSGVCRYEF